MIVVLSGEGPTDLGQCLNQQGHCVHPEFSFGPMTVIIDQIIQSKCKYSILDQAINSFRFFSENHLKERELIRKNEKRSVSLKGKKREEETGYFYINAWMLGEIAKKISEDENDTAIAILFRDSDGTNSSPSNLWIRKWNSMIAGFERSGFSKGIPMLPQPKSEAWLLCAAKENPYQFCSSLEEDLPGNDKSPNSAKSKLNAAMNGKASSSDLNDWLTKNPYDHEKASYEMKSFEHFRNRLLEVLP